MILLVLSMLASPLAFAAPDFTLNAYPSSGPGTVGVTIPPGTGLNQSLNFSPTTLKVIVGVNNTITWTNRDLVQHTVTSTSVPAGANTFDSGTFSNGGQFSVTLAVPGTYQYHCTIHPGWMQGTIVVVAAVSTTTSSSALTTTTSGLTTTTLASIAALVVVVAAVGFVIARRRSAGS